MSKVHGTVTGAVFIGVPHPSERRLARAVLPLLTPASGTDRTSNIAPLWFNDQHIQVAVTETASDDHGDVSLLFSIHGQDLPALVPFSAAPANSGIETLSPNAPFRAVSAKIQTGSSVPHTVEGQRVYTKEEPGQGYTVHVLAYVKKGGKVWSLVNLKGPFLQLGGREYSLKVLDNAPWLEEKWVLMDGSLGSGDGQLMGPEGNIVDGLYGKEGEVKSGS